MIYTYPFFKYLKIVMDLFGFNLDFNKKIQPFRSRRLLDFYKSKAYFL